jgi:hypothetical protein
MPYLNLRELPVTREIRPLDGQTAGEERDFAMRVVLGAEALGRLADALSALGIGAELRVDLPGDWTLFWKAREGESRMLVAHPESEQWVATLALSPSHLALAVAALRAGAASVHSLEALSSVSNLELEIATHG